MSKQILNAILFTAAAAGCVGADSTTPLVTRVVPGNNAASSTVELEAGDGIWSVVTTTDEDGTVTSTMHAPDPDVWTRVVYGPTQLHWTASDGATIHDVTATMRKGDFSMVPQRPVRAGVADEARSVVGGALEWAGARGLNHAHVHALAVATAGGAKMPPELPGLLGSLGEVTDPPPPPWLAQVAPPMPVSRGCTSLPQNQLVPVTVDVRLPKASPGYPWNVWSNSDTGSWKIGTEFRCDALEPSSANSSEVGMRMQMYCVNGSADIATIGESDASYSEIENITDSSSNFESVARNNAACNLIGWSWWMKPDRATKVALNGGQIRGAANDNCVGGASRPALLGGGCRINFTGPWDGDIYGASQAEITKYSAGLPENGGAVLGKVQLTGILAFCEEFDTLESNDVAMEVSDARINYTAAGCNEQLPGLPPARVDHLIQTDVAVAP